MTVKSEVGKTSYSKVQENFDKCYCSSLVMTLCQFNLAWWGTVCALLILFSLQWNNLNQMLFVTSLMTHKGILHVVQVSDHHCDPPEFLLCITINSYILLLATSRPSATNHTVPICIQLTVVHQKKQTEHQQLAINVDTMLKTTRTTKITEKMIC